MPVAVIPKAQQIRISIALLALSHKPPEQSISSYLIDLQEHFAIHQRHTGDDLWRIKALALEEENDKLRVSVQKYELEILALKVAPSGTEESNPEAESSQAAKKRKVAQTVSKKAPDRFDLRALVKDIRSGPRLPILQDSLDILTSFRNVIRPSESHAHKINQTILIPNMKRSLSALGKLLSASLARDGSVVAVSSRVDVLNSFCDLLHTLLDSTLPLAPCEEVLPHIMGDLTICIVRPIIHAFHTLSVREVTNGLKDSDRKKSEVDIRPDLRRVLQRLIECLRALKASTRDLREFMVFETVKEIEALWSLSSSKKQPSREQRIEILARKDSFWYHCSILHCALDRFPPSRSSEAGEESLLCSEAVRVLADLMRHFEHRSPVDEIARSMLLGVLEKAWLSGLYQPPSGEVTPEKDICTNVTVGK